MKRALLTAGIALATVAVTVLPANASTSSAVPVYDATPVAGTPNIPSEGPEAYAFKELGDAVNLASSTGRTLNAVSVTMSSWACQSGTWNAGNCLSAAGSHFSQPITLSIYGAPVAGPNNTVLPGDLIARVTKTFNLPYRPSHNKHCSGGEWYNRTNQTCYNGKAATISWNFTSLQLSLPDTIVLGVSYNTTHYGYNPIGTSASCFSTSEGCAYDSLNIGLNDDPNAPTVGTEASPGAIFQNSDLAGEYCDSTPATGEFNEDSPTDPCWAGYVPAFKVTAH